MKKRIFSLFLTLVLCLALCASLGVSASANVSDDINWKDVPEEAAYYLTRATNYRKEGKYELAEGDYCNAINELDEKSTHRASLHVAIAEMYWEAAKSLEGRNRMDYFQSATISYNNAVEFYKGLANAETNGVYKKNYLGSALYIMKTEKLCYEDGWGCAPTWLINEIESLDKQLTASVLSEGNLAIVIVVAVLAVGSGAALIIVKKKKKNTAE